MDYNENLPENPCQKLRNYLRKINVPLFILVCLFAMSSWIDINAIWVELPLLVRTAPESWALASYVVIVIQIANVGPLIFTIAKTAFPKRVKEWPVIISTIVVGIVASILLIFFWDRTTVWAGINELRSTGLLVLSLFLSLVDCTSSVLYFPYMSTFNSQYMTALFVGEGMSGLVPAILGLAQLTEEDKWIPVVSNVSEIQPVNKNNQLITVTDALPISNAESTITDPITWTLTPLYSIENETVWVTKTTYVAQYAKERFSVSIYFLLIAILLLISLTSFLLIHFLPYFKRIRNTQQNSLPALKMPNGVSRTEEVDNYSDPYSNTTSSSQISDVDYSNSAEINAEKNNSSTFQYEESTDNLTRTDSSENSIKSDKTKLYLRGIGLLLITAWINGLTNGVLPSLQTYSAQPYGFLAYNLHVKLSVLVNPLACFVALFVHVRRFWLVFVLTFCASVLAGFQIALACLSPNPPLKGTSNGIASLVTTQVLLTAIFSYTKVTIATIMSKMRGKHWLLFFGGATQLGSLIGAIITFCLVNFTNIFQSGY